ncbi:U32 family peptidase [Ralstonia pickettii]|nr:U32 family peptidase [Ralstonia pickettii]
MEIVATAESVNQAKLLVTAGIDVLYIGEDEFGLRLPASFSQDEVTEITDLAHEHGKKVRVALNFIMHNDRINKVVPYLKFLQETGVDSITVGDPGIIQLMRKHNISIPFFYDGQTLVTSARQINFWTKRGAAGAVLARELTYPELKEIAAQVTVPVEVLVYGATCIHQSKRPLIQNYFQFVDSAEDTGKERGLFISEPKNKNTHYSIYEDRNGTHIFATNDVNLLPELKGLADAGLTEWKLDGIFTKGENYVSIVKLFVQAKRAIESGQWTDTLAEKLNEQLTVLHPRERGLDKGFYSKDPSEVQ